MWRTDPSTPNLLRWYENGQPTAYTAWAQPAPVRRDWTGPIFALLATAAFLAVLIFLLTGLDNLMK